MGLNVADTPDDAESFVDEYDWSWDSMQDPDRERARLLGATYQPHFVLVDADGAIVDAHEGAAALRSGSDARKAPVTPAR